MRSSPTSTEPRRRPRAGRAAALLCAWAGALLAAGCSEVTVATPTPTPSALPSLPPIGFNHRYGNNPVTAADASGLERSLFARKEYWEVAMAGTPVAAGFVDRADAALVARARAQTTELTMVIASEVLATLRSFIAGGHPAQQAYCETLVAGLRTMGYSGLTKVTLDVFFGEMDRHARLTWTPSGSTYTVLDGGIENTLVTPPPGGTPFPLVTPAASTSPAAPASPSAGG